MTATPFTPDPHTPSRAESLMRIARLAQPGSAPPFEAAVSLLTAYVLLCRQEDQDPVTTASWLLPVIAETVATEIASPAPVYQDIMTRRDPWPRLIERKGKTPVLRLASFGGAIDLLPLNAMTSDYDYDLYRSALTLALSFDHWREETRTDATGQTRRVAVLENPSGAAEHIAFEADMYDAEATARAPRYRLIDRKTGIPIDVSAQVTALEPRAHGRPRTSRVCLTFARRSEYLLTEPLYGLKPGTALALWYGSLL